MFIDEDNKIELKEIINNTLPKEIVAFLNTDGGTIYMIFTRILCVTSNI